MTEPSRRERRDDAAFRAHAAGVPTPARARVPRGRLARAFTLLSAHRYAIAGAVLLALMARELAQGRWGEGYDIWEHAAVVRELARHPLHPRHPLFPTDSPHQFYSPYAVALGLIARASGLPAGAVLAGAGVVNLTLLLLGLHRFATRLLRHRHVAFYALLFTLFLWGPDPWVYSGFFHANALAHVLPYPSTFAAALVLLALASWMTWIERDGHARLFFLVASAAVILTTHPFDVVALAAGMAALAADGRLRLGQRLPALAALAAGSVLLAFLWPYFSLRELLLGDATAGYRAALGGDNRLMYSAVLTRTFPALLGVPFILLRLRRDRRDALAWMGLALAGVYGYGWLFAQWSYGRVIGFVVLTLHLSLADARAEAGEAAARLGPPARALAWWAAIGTAALLIIGAGNVRQGVLGAVPLARRLLDGGVTIVTAGEGRSLDELAYVADQIGEDDVVLADPATSWMVPAVRGKVLVALHPQAFAPDTAAQAADVRRVLTPGTPDAERRRLLAAHAVDWLIVPTRLAGVAPDTYRELVELGEVRHRDRRDTLIHVERTCRDRPGLTDARW